MTYRLKRTAVAFFIFNRLDTASRVFAKIREAQPPRLLVIADGPRADHPGEAEKCQACRDLIKQVDWDCEVLTNFSATNMGCGMRPKTGYDWVFSEVEEAILLEDDTLPDNSFFQFAEELLERYRDDRRVMLIGGTNFLPAGLDSSGDSYYFSRMMQTWGWAAWRRTWENYDFDIKKWREVRAEHRLRTFMNGEDEWRWMEHFDKLYRHELTAEWDTQLLFKMWTESSLCIIPRVNMVSHIGVDGTHFINDTNYEVDPNSPNCRPLVPMEFPLVHPELIMPKRANDKYMFDWQRGARSLRGMLHFRRLYYRELLRRLLRGPKPLE